MAKRIRNGFENMLLDVQAMRDEVFDLYDRLDAVEVGMRARLRGDIPPADTPGRRSLMGSRQLINSLSSSDLRSSTLSLNRGTIG